MTDKLNAPSQELLDEAYKKGFDAGVMHGLLLSANPLTVLADSFIALPLD